MNDTDHAPVSVIIAGMGAGPTPLDASVSRRMSRQASRDTQPERALRSALHRLGMRFRKDVALLPDKRLRADVVFPRERVAVYVHGCFWHGCPTHASWPRTNAEWWRAKIERNRERDRETTAALVRAGWHVVEIWEHEDPEQAADAIASLVRSRRLRQNSSTTAASKPT